MKTQLSWLSQDFYYVLNLYKNSSSITTGDNLLFQGMVTFWIQDQKQVFDVTLQSNDWKSVKVLVGSSL